MSASTFKDDIYEDTTGDEKAQKFLKRFGHVETLQAGLGDDFDDEEIEEDEAFDEMDLQKWGDIGSGKRKREDQEHSDNEEADDEGIYINLSDLLDRDEIDEAKHSELLKKLDSSSRPKKRGRQEVDEIREEGQFNAFGQPKLMISDLMAGVSTKIEYGNLRSHMSRLQKNEMSQLEAKPVHKAQKDRNLRQVQFEDTSKLVSEWAPTVLQMQTAEHLEFPLNAPKAERISLATLSAKHKEGGLGSKIDAILEESGIQKAQRDLDEHDQMVKEKAITQRDLQLKTQELAKMRHLLHYQEKKLQWHSKIKSKRYRRILRKAKEKNNLTFEELKELDPEAAAIEATKRDKERALERMTQRHKAGKFAKQAKRNINNPALKQALAEQHAIALEKKKRTDFGADSSDDEFDSDVSGESDDEESYSAESKPETEKGLWAMKFMKRGEEREKQQYEELKAQFDEEHNNRVRKIEEFVEKRKAKEKQEKGENVDPVEEVQSEPTVTGRRSFTKPTQRQTEQPEKLAKNTTNKPTKDKLREDATQKIKPGQASAPSQEGQSSKTHTPSKGEASQRNQSERSVGRFGLTLIESKGLKNAKQEDSEEEEAPENAPKLKTSIETQTVPRKAPQEDSSDDEGTTEFNLVGKASAKQRELIMRAFANDDVEAQFAEAKRQLVEKDLPSDQAEPSLPGWGSWSGVGIVEKPRAPNKRKAEALKAKRQEALDKRKDAKQGHVIINQTPDKMASKYQLATVPEGLSSADVYHSNIKTPIGREFNSVLAYHELARPRVTVKTGEIIEPVQKKVKRDPKTTLSGGLQKNNKPQTKNAPK